MKSPEELQELMLAGTKSIDYLVFKLSLLNPLDLALLKVKGHPKVQSMLDTLEFTPLWENKFNKLRIPENSDFKFRSPGSQSKANFYCGYILYLHALNQKKFGLDYSKFLSLAITTFKSFHAYQDFLSSLFIKVEIDPKNEVLQHVFVFLNTKTSELQFLKTPGCLLLANSYFQLTLLFQALGLEAETMECYKNCWTNLHLAELLKKDSEREIHNAYYGEGLKASNALGQDSIIDIKNSLLGFDTSFLTEDVRTCCESAAKDIFEHYFKKPETEEARSSFSIKPF